MRRTYTIPTCGAQRPVADDFALQLHWCGAGRTTAKTPVCAGTKEDSWTFCFCQSRRAFLKALLLCLFGGERQGSVVRPFLASSPLSIVKIDVSEISKPSTRLPHPEKWQPRSLKMLSNKKEVLLAATHSGVRRQRLGTTPSTQTFTTGRSFWRQTSSSSSLISTRAPYLGRATVCVRINRQVVVVKAQFFWNGL